MRLKYYLLFLVILMGACTVSVPEISQSEDSVAISFPNSTLQIIGNVKINGTFGLNQSDGCLNLTNGLITSTPCLNSSNGGTSDTTIQSWINGNRSEIEANQYTFSNLSDDTGNSTNVTLTTVNGRLVATLNLSCVQMTGSAALCDGSDATGTGIQNGSADVNITNLKLSQINGTDLNQLFNRGNVTSNSQIANGAGYITGFTETDPVYTPLNTSNIFVWNSTWVNVLIDNRVTQSFIQALGFLIGSKIDSLINGNRSEIEANQYTFSNLSDDTGNSTNVTLTTVNGRLVATLNLSCVQMTGSAALCDGSDATGSGIQNGSADVNITNLKLSQINGTDLNQLFNWGNVTSNSQIANGAGYITD